MPPEGPVQVTLVAFPMWTVWFIIGINVILVALMVVILLKVKDIFLDISKMVNQAQREAMPPVIETLKNVKTMSDEAAKTTQNVTDAANRVSKVVSSVATRVESPAVKAAGLISGVMAGARAVKSSKPVEESKLDKKKGGKRGFLR